MNMSNNTQPITEEMIEKLVDMTDSMNSMMYGTPPLTPEERAQVIAELHSKLFVKIDRGHFVKEKDHTPWYMAAKAELPAKFWDRYRLYLLKEKHWNGKKRREPKTSLFFGSRAVPTSSCLSLLRMQVALHLSTRFRLLTLTVTLN